MTDYCSELAGVVLRRYEALRDTQGQDMIQANKLWKTQLLESEAELQATDAKWFEEEAKAGRSTEGMPQLKGCKLEYVDDFDVFMSLPCDDFSDRGNTLPLSTGSAPPLTFGLLVYREDEDSKKTAYPDNGLADLPATGFSAL